MVSVRKGYSGINISDYPDTLGIYGISGRGQVPVKFNGGLFTQQLLLSFNDKTKRSGNKDTLSYGLLSHPDDRLWGRRFTFQNQRHLYWHY